MLYYSEITNKNYKTIEELEQAEAEKKNELKALEEKKKEKKKRAEEVEQAFKDAKEAQQKANELLQAFCKDYGAFHTTYSKTSTNNLFDWLEWRFPF